MDNSLCSPCGYYKVIISASKEWEESKQCSRCKNVKPVSLFNKDSLKKDGHRSECRECQQKRKQANNLYFNLRY